MAPATALVAIAYCSGLEAMFARGVVARRLAIIAIAISFVAMIVAYFRPFATKPDLRTSVARILESKPGAHLLVADQRCADIVFNGAAVDDQKIVWTTQHDNERPLFDYYADRNVWRLTCGMSPQLAFTRAATKPHDGPLEPDAYIPRRFQGLH